jgi:hypothetical protein
MAVMLAFVTVHFIIMVEASLGAKLSGLQEALFVYRVCVPEIVSWAVMVTSNLIATW